MQWNELSIKAKKEAEEALANLLNEHGANGVVIEEKRRIGDERFGFQFGEIYDLPNREMADDEVVLKAYFLDDEKWPKLLEQINESIAGLADHNLPIESIQIELAIVQESDWENEWKQYFKPFKVTEQFVIVPTWEQYEAEKDQDLTILMDPGMAFGTGTHATTKLSLLALEKTMKPNDLVIDVGSGSGILSIAASLLQASHVYSYDLDQVAVNSTIYNRDLNGFSDSITVKQNDLLKGVTHKEKADLVIANILAHIILQLIEDAWKQLKVGGSFIVSGIIEKEVDRIQKALEANRFTVEEILTEDHWYTFIARKKG